MILPSAARFGRRLANELYEVAFPVYRPLYRLFKAVSDRGERQLLKSNLSPGSVVVDAGANIGVYSQFLAECVGPTGTVHSFEPSPDNFARLERALSGLENVRLNQLAVSDHTGNSLLYVSDELNVDHRLYQTEQETRRTVSIQSTTLDDYFQAGARVDLMKMDIQGYELCALRGAERVLADNPKIVLLLEFWPYGLIHAGASPAQLISFLQERGFCFMQGDDGLRLSELPVLAAYDETSYCNVLARR